MSSRESLCCIQGTTRALRQHHDQAHLGDLASHVFDVKRNVTLIGKPMQVWGDVQTPRRKTQDMATATGQTQNLLTVR